MQNPRRSHSLQPINQAQVVDPEYQESPSLVSTTNLAQVLQQTATQRTSASQSPSSSQAPSLERSPPVTRRSTSRPTQSPPPPPIRPPPYTSSAFFCSHPASFDEEHTWSSRQRLEAIFRGLIPDPNNTRPRRSPLTFQPTRTVRDNIELINDVKQLIIQASELHQDIEVKLTRIQLLILRQEFERQDKTNNFH
jgi:hypothetical protein